MSFTIIIIVVTVLISIAAFNNADMLNKLILWPRRMDSPAEYYRLLTCGFVHVDYMHLAFNMITLYFFGRELEVYFGLLGRPLLFPILYLSGIVASSLPSYIRHKDNSYYRSLGASGGVAAIIFSAIYFSPWTRIYIIVLPLPAILFAVGYLLYSAYMDKHGSDNIGHNAHFWGAVYGFVFTLLFDPTHGRIFFEQLMHPSF
ncbi:MAG: rhomboid family intramembrane serine protease [Bacteroidetes bacterium 43-93]|nr:rhomboid family intramembrane serine protease [Bacteroidota bacterium]OJX01655.1 MAG: rhomboid family intramembrane serine protease [Bacteroidetes bacterium 43-93]